MSFTSVCPLIFSLTRSAFRERRSPELLFCIVMWLLPLRWGGKVGWQLFLKPGRTLSRDGFFLHFFPSPLCKQRYSSLPPFSLSTSLVRRQETKLRSITKSSKAIWSPVSASRPQHRGTGVPCLRNNAEFTHNKMQASKEARRIYLIFDHAVHLWNRSITEGEESLLAPVKMNNISSSVHCDYTRNTGGKKNIQKLSQGGFIFPIIGSNPNSPCQIITRTLSSE